MNKSEFEATINAVGVPAVFTPVAAPSLPIAIDRVGFQSLAKAEETIVNAYGVNGRQIHIKASSLPAPPVKYDVVTVGGVRCVLESVIPKFEHGSGAVMGWACYCVGE